MTRLTRVFLAVAAISLAACHGADIVTGPNAHRRVPRTAALSGTYALSGGFDTYSERITGRLTFSDGGSVVSVIIEGMGSPIVQSVTVSTVPAGTITFTIYGGAAVDWVWTGQSTDGGATFSGRQHFTGPTALSSFGGPWTAAK